MDLNTGLTQVLADGTNTYLYGTSRIGQFTDSDSAYFLGDALGSVRQLTDNTGEVTMAKDYQPYGEVLRTAGDGISAYGYTAEWSAQSDLLFLRARYYMIEVGRFLTRDEWEGDYSIPMSYNVWLYGYANPINNTDPTGRYTCTYKSSAEREQVMNIYGYESCKEFPDLILENVKNTSGVFSNALMTRYSRYESAFTFLYSNHVSNPQGGPTSVGKTIIVIPPVKGIPRADEMRETSKDLNTLAYISVVGHELWHAFMQTPVPPGSAYGEAEAYMAQSHLLEELNGSEWTIQFLKDQAVENFKNDKFLAT